MYLYFHMQIDDRLILRLCACYEMEFCFVDEITFFIFHTTKSAKKQTDNACMAFSLQYIHIELQQLIKGQKNLNSLKVTDAVSPGDSF